MQKRHFETIAAVIFTLDLTPGTREIIAVNFADALKRENRRFKYGVFMTACGFPRYERQHDVNA